MARVLGIDPGSETTGWGVVDGDARRSRLVEYGVVRSSVKEKFPARLLNISNGLEKVIERLRPETCAVEEAFFAVNVKTALKLGQVRGAILVTAERAGLEIAEYAGQLGLHRKPCALFDVDGYYAPLVAFLDHACAEGFLRAEHRALVIVEAEPAALLARLRAARPPEAPTRIAPAET